MRNIRLLPALLSAVILGLPGGLWAQDDALHFEVNRVYTSFTITKAELEQARSLKDLNQNFKAEWVKQYQSVEISGFRIGIEESISSESDMLSAAQLALMTAADAGTPIAVLVKYLPDNQLKNNEIKTMRFSVIVDPEQEAEYPGGDLALRQFLETQAIQNIPAGSFTGYALAAVTFVVNEEGLVEQVEIVESAGQETIDHLLTETIRKMPCWKPAAYADGTKVSRKFALTVGNMENCMVPLLQIHRPNLK